MPGEASENNNLGNVIEPEKDSGLLHEPNHEDQASVDAYVERMRARHKAFEFFRNQFTPDISTRSITTTIINSEGVESTIGIGIKPEPQQVESVDLDQSEPVSFSPTNYSMYFYRKEPDIKAKVKNNSATAEDSIELDFSWIDSEPTVEELDEQAKNFNAINSNEAILNDLKQKFTSLGFPDIPIEVYAKRLLKGDEFSVNQTVSRAKADLLMPLYRSVEIKRLKDDPTSPDTDHLQIITRRQHVYDQLTNLLRESGMNPEQMTRYLIDGIFDSHLVAGVPVFADGDNRYLIINCAFGGYDEKNPTGTDFEGKIAERSYSEISDILKRAEAHGYATHFDNSAVSGGTHQHWQWDGIKIDGFDEENPENNIPKIMKILKDVGIDPDEASSTIDPGSVTDLYIR